MSAQAATFPTPEGSPAAAAGWWQGQLHHAPALRSARPATRWRLELPDGQSVWVRGPMTGCVAGDQVRVRGVQEPSGELRVLWAQPQLPVPPQGLLRWLVAHAHGVGPATAQRLLSSATVAHISAALEDADAQSWCALLRTAGCAAGSRAHAAHLSAYARRATRDLEAVLLGCDLSVHMVSQLFARFGAQTLSVLRSDPYRVTCLAGIGFRRADRVAVGLGLAQTAPARLTAALGYVLEQAAAREGHSYLTPAQLLPRAAGELDLDDQQALGLAVGEMVAAGQAVQEGDRIYLSDHHKLELRVAARVRQALQPTGQPLLPVAVLNALSDAQLSDEQRGALARTLHHRLSVLTGPPGSGKTSTLRALVGLCEAQGVSVLLAAPTGKAARRMAQLCGHHAQTLHRLLEWHPASGRWGRDARRPLQARLVIVDEASMLSLAMAAKLLDAVGPATHLLLVGDAQQLPAVGMGRVFADLCDSPPVQAARLTCIYRQAQHSLLGANARRVASGQSPWWSCSAARASGSRAAVADCFLLAASDAEDAAEQVVQLMAGRLERTLGVAFSHTMVLSPMRAGACGTRELNRRLEACLNPDGRSVGNSSCRVGSRLVAVANDYASDVMNGELCVLADAGGGQVLLRFDDGRQRELHQAQLANFELGWALTIHRAQGSEFPAVVMPVVAGHSAMLTRSLLYTAMTRAQQALVMVSDAQTLRIATSRQDTVLRHSGLTARISDAASDGRLF